MTFKLEINCDNAAFNDMDNELEQILTDVLMAFHTGELHGNVRDSNGNTVGHFQFKGKRKE